MNKTSVESDELGKTLDLELSFLCPPPKGIGLGVVGGSVWACALGGLFLSLGEAYVSDLLLCLEPLKKIVGGGGGGQWLRVTLVLSFGLGQAQQYHA